MQYFSASTITKMCLIVKGPSLKLKTKATLIGTRNMNRAFDVRVAANNDLEEKYGIKEGDIFMLSTQAVRFDVPDLARTRACRRR